ncbi:MAG: alpha/beta fold hydrolase [Gammaproteobacteria bacterium]|jgi:homoserine O-acetyltransferase|nr:alpha/beta fold hydrolase [Gammaproteobacteria bacterium]|tara:strand:- start:182 stop:1192 length:1011 start_codon:yes stop_codon:yes gene_type:complete
MNYEKFELGNVPLLSGEELNSAFLTYKTYGKLNNKKNNVVVLPTFYTGSHQRNEGFFGEGRAIDPDKHFIVSINMFGNGFSSSPSNTKNLQDGPRFPNVSLWDNIACQYKLLTESLGVNRIALVAGWSMAGCQAYQWAAQYPDFVDAILPFCASAKTSPHNFVFLEGVKAALCADQNWNNGEYISPPIDGLKAFARVYAGWAFSQTFYRESLFKKIGYETIEDLLVDWENDHIENWDANNLLTKLATWQSSDISVGPLYNGNFILALKSIKAKTILMPCTQDLYFPPKDNFIEARYIMNAEIRPFDSPLGHCVANPGNDLNFELSLDRAIVDLIGT